MTRTRPAVSAPRWPSGAGAHLRRQIRPGAVLVRILLLCTILFGVPVGSLSAQEPADTVVVGDSLTVTDSVAVADSVDPEADTLSADTIFYNFPDAGGGVAAGLASGVWEWDRHAIMSSGANTLADLFQEVPGMVALMGGDYGTPVAVSTFGQGGGGYRILRDGFEVYGVEGGVVDLQQVGLVGISRVRLDRSMAQMVIEMWSHQYDDGRPFSVVEAGTGDLDTNLFRGVYTDPTALWGSLGAGLERLDTRGRSPDRSEGGNRTGGWVRYQLHLRDRLAVGVEYRGAKSQTRVTDYVPTVSRNDLVIRAGVKIVDGVTIQAFGGRSVSDFEGQAVYDSVAMDSVFTSRGGTVSQFGGRLGVNRGRFWLDASGRLYGLDLPADRFDAAGGWQSPRWGGVAGRWARSTWVGEGVSSHGLRGWFSPVPLITAFAAWEKGSFGNRAGPLLDDTPSPDVLPEEVAVITERQTVRLGGVLSGLGATLSGASIYAWSDRSVPLGLELDLGAPPVAGLHRYGLEAMAVLPTPMPGLTLEGSYQRWDKEGPYLPRQIYQGAFQYHRVFKETGNLEVWGTAGVRGHDPMLSFVPVDPDADPDAGGTPGLARVPFYQNWYARLQVRVLTVRLWIGIENLTFRRDLRTYPDRPLPYARSFFALRWDLWN